ncbi:MAG: hypothetical protein ACRC7V_07525 [Lachnospiraceae bacterium]
MKNEKTKTITLDEAITITTSTNDDSALSQQNAWMDYSKIHDTFSELLSYTRKTNLGYTSIWDYEYV